MENKIIQLNVLFADLLVVVKRFLFSVHKFNKCYSEIVVIAKLFLYETPYGEIQRQQVRRFDMSPVWFNNTQPLRPSHLSNWLQI